MPRMTQRWERISINKSDDEAEAEQFAKAVSGMMLPMAALADRLGLCRIAYLLHEVHQEAKIAMDPAELH